MYTYLYSARAHVFVYVFVVYRAMSYITVLSGKRWTSPAPVIFGYGIQKKWKIL